MKTILALIATAALLLSFSTVAEAQTYGYQSFSLPVSIAASTTTNVALKIDATKVKDVAVNLNFKMNGAADSNTVVTIQRSVDGVNFDTVNPITWTIPQNGTTAVVATTNIAVGGYGWLRLYSIQNGHGSAIVTNISASYSIKRGAM